MPSPALRGERAFLHLKKQLPGTCCPTSAATLAQHRARLAQSSFLLRIVPHEQLLQPMRILACDINPQHADTATARYAIPFAAARSRLWLAPARRSKMVQRQQTYRQYGDRVARLAAALRCRSCLPPEPLRDLPHIAPPANHGSVAAGHSESRIGCPRIS